MIERRLDAVRRNGQTNQWKEFRFRQENANRYISSNSLVVQKRGQNGPRIFFLKDTYFRIIFLRAVPPRAAACCFMITLCRSR